MERSLLWSALAIGVFGYLCGLLMVRAGRRESGETAAALPRSAWIASVAVALLVFVATLPSRPPLFAEGHGFGNGFLLGGLAALLAGWGIGQGRHNGAAASTATQATAIVAAPCSLALVVAAVPLLWMRSTVEDALMGGAIGWFVITFLLILSLGRRGTNGRGLTLPLAIGTAFTTLVCGVALLGEYRGAVDWTGAHSLSWSAVGLTFAAGIPFALLLSALPASTFARVALRLPFAGVFARWSGRLFPADDDQQAAALGGRLVFGSLLLLVLGRLLGARIAAETVAGNDGKHTALGHLLASLTRPIAWAVGPSPVFHVIVIGLLGGLVAWWVIASQLRQEQESAESSPAMETRYGELAVFFVAAGIMAAYQMLAGFGVGLLLLSASLAVATAVAASLQPVRLRDSNSPPGPTDTANESGLKIAALLVRLLLFGVIIVLYRVVGSRFDDDLHGVALTDHYALFGILLGILLPSLLARFLVRPLAGTATTPGSEMLRVVLTGVLTLLLPAIVLALWGPKCLLALLLGLAVAAALTDVWGRVVLSVAGQTRASTVLESFSLLPALLALAIGLALAQWTGHVLPLSELTRDQKVHYLTWAMGILILLLLIGDVSARIGAQRQRQQAGGGSEVAKGGAQ
jgi:hypothetical protein